MRFACDLKVGEDDRPGLTFCVPLALAVPVGMDNFDVLYVGNRGCNFGKVVCELSILFAILGVKWVAIVINDDFGTVA